MVCTQHLCLWRCPWPIKNVSRQRLCGKVCGTHRRRSKAPVCNISTAAHDRSKEISLIGLSDVLKREHKAAERCHICLKEFSDPQNKKVGDHCRYTGWYRRAAHNNCNLKYRIPDHIPIVFHNLSGYDAHLFIKELGRRFNKNDIGVIAENKEKYISFNVKINIKLAGLRNKDGKEVPKNVQLGFIDSCMSFRRTFLSWWTTVFLERRWKISGTTRIWS